jgi:hypothetical protein
MCPYVTPNAFKTKPIVPHLLRPQVLGQLAEVQASVLCLPEPEDEVDEVASVIGKQFLQFVTKRVARNGLHQKLHLDRLPERHEAPHDLGCARQKQQTFSAWMDDARLRDKNSRFHSSKLC